MKKREGIHRLMDAYVDGYGQIAQGAPIRDGGDSAAFAGQAMVGYQFALVGGTQRHAVEVLKYRMRLDALYVGYGRLRRHPVKPEWAARKDRMSRDQMLPNIVGSGYAYPRLAWLLVIWLVLRLGFTTNVRKNWELDPPLKLPDWCGPKVWGACIRALKLWPLYPLLLITDWHLVIDSWLRGLKSDNNEINHIVVMLQALDRAPTPVAKLAAKIYAKREPQKALDWFYGARNDIEPPMHDLYRPFLARKIK